MTRIFDFMKARTLMLIVSAVIIVAGIAGTVVQGGFNLGIDFQAGLNLTVDITGGPATTAEAVRRAVAPIDQGIQVQQIGAVETGRYAIRVRDTGNIANFESVMAQELLNTLRQAFPGATIQELETSYVGPRFSRDLTEQAFFLTVFALFLILAYLWFRFRLAYAFSSIAALVHDVVVILGLIGALQLEVSTATIAAVLTIIGYSLNDTIVIFDRIRENEMLLRDSSLPAIVNTSIAQSLSRTLITSITTLLAVTAIYIFSTGQIQNFALTLMVGVVIGTYSSIFVASPVLVGWTNYSKARQRKRDAEKYHRGPTSSKAEVAAASAGDSTAAMASNVEIERAKREIAQLRNQKKKK